MAPGALLSQREKRLHRGKGSELLLDPRLVITTRGRTKAQTSKTGSTSLSLSLVISLIVWFHHRLLLYSCFRHRLPLELKHPARLAPAHHYLFIHWSLSFLSLFPAKVDGETQERIALGRLTSATLQKSVANIAVCFTLETVSVNCSRLTSLHPVHSRLTSCFARATNLELINNRVPCLPQRATSGGGSSREVVAPDLE